MVATNCYSPRCSYSSTTQSQVCMMYMYGCVLLLCASALGQAAPLLAPVARPPQGPVQGVQRGTVDGRPTTAFLGIPYAMPPVGGRRFRPPEPHPVWEEVYQATELGPACPQDYSVLRLIAPDQASYERWAANLTYAEDCLNLNVYYPGEFTEREEGIAEGREERLPVLVWIHGGGYMFGSAYFGTAGDMLAAEQGVLVVSIHYRLGALGFLTTEHPSYPGNMGLYDQRLALRWVKDNIRAFGGDPDAVTIFGESAGSWAVSAHMVSPGSAGLFQRAIGQSGSTFNLQPQPQEVVAASSRELARRAGCPPEHDVECLRGVAVSRLVEISMEIMVEGHQITACLDGDFMPLDSLERIRTGNINKVPSIWSTTVYEAGVMLAGMFPGVSPMDRGMTRNETEAVLQMISQIYLRPEPVYEELLSFYLPDGLDDVWENVAQAGRALSDLMFEGPKAYKLDSLASHGADVYEGVFYARPQFMPEHRYKPGAFHGDDIYYVFGDFVYTNGTDREMTLSRSTMHAWGTFAKTGVPTYLDAEGGQHTWPVYDIEEMY